MATVKASITVALLLLSYVPPMRCNAPKGHLEPLGNQRPPEQTVQEVYQVPNPAVFWAEYVKSHSPVVFRGAAKYSRAYELWTEEYLVQEYGDVILRLEARAENDRRIPVGEGELLGRDTMKHFITNYLTMNAYVISQIPQPMERDISIPPCLRCGSIAKAIQEVHLFLSAKGGKTVIHRDPYSNIHCLFNGTKEWILIDPMQTQSLYQSEESVFEYGGFSLVNVDAVDLTEHPQIQDVKYAKLTLNRGDCIFIPGGYWHQVRSWGHMNSAVSIWFSRLTEFDDEDCNTASINFTPMNDVMILWRYSGDGNLTQGHMDIYLVQKLLILWADASGKIWLQSFVQHFFHTEHSGERYSELEEDARRRGVQLLEFLDPSRKGYVDKAQVERMTIEALRDMLLIFDPSDVSNHDDFEYSHIEEEDVRDILETSFNEHGFFDTEMFVNKYTMDLGGTNRKAEEIVARLTVSKRENLTWTEVEQLAPSALEEFTTARRHDPSFEHLMFRYLQQHWRQHDEL